MHTNKKGEVETANLIGGSMAGIPLVAIGKSDHLSWGITAAATDVADLFRENI